MNAVRVQDWKEYMSEKSTALERHMARDIMVLRQERREYLEEPKQEYKFHPRRKWRFDFAWPKMLVAVEVEGGKWVKGRHQRPQGFEADCEKYNEAARMGWRVFRFTGDMIEDGRALATLEAVFPPF